MSSNLIHPSEDYVRDCYSLDTAVTDQILCLYDLILNENFGNDTLANIID